MSSTSTVNLQGTLGDLQYILARPTINIGLQVQGVSDLTAVCTDATHLLWRLILLAQRSGRHELVALIKPELQDVGIHFYTPDEAGQPKQLVGSITLPIV